jgi:hypothetical protein
MINVGTANNDDYSNAQFPESWGPYAGLPVRLADSINVQPLTYGMTDDRYIEWIQKPSAFVQQSSPKAAMTKAESAQSDRTEVELIPAEWNYYGDMGMTMMGVNVLAVQYSDHIATDPNEDQLVGAELSFNNRPGDTGRSTGMLIDVNPESVPCSQIFADFLTLEKSGEAIFSGKPSKSVTRWINFQRNTNLGGPNGAAGSFQCVVPLEEIAGQPIVEILSQGNEGKPLAGLVFRYVLYRNLQKINTFKYSQSEWFEKIVALYQQQGLNPGYAQLCGTISPWFADEMKSVPAGRALYPTNNTFPVPPGSKGNGSQFLLAPAMFAVDKDAELISLDFSATFPDNYTSTVYDPLQTDDNPKYDFNQVNLLVRSGSSSYDFGPIDYQDTGAGDRAGWVFDISLKGLSADVLKLIDQGDFALNSPQYGDLLAEADYFIASDQSCIFGEQGRQGETSDKFVNESGMPETATIRVFQKGRELDAYTSPPLTVWEYDTTPNQKPGIRKQTATGFKPGQALIVDVSSPGNRLFTFTLPGQPDPPPDTNGLNLTVIPQINLRLLPNDKDYSQYYQNPQAEQPVGNDKLTFEVIFAEVLRNYYLLYPAMSLRVPLDDPEQWSDPVMAGLMMQRTQESWWDKAEYMPRTRDLSASRRKLLHAWCRKFTDGNAQTT